MNRIEDACICCKYWDLSTDNLQDLFQNPSSDPLGQCRKDPASVSTTASYVCSHFVRRSSNPGNGARYSILVGSSDGSSPTRPAGEAVIVGGRVAVYLDVSSAGDADKAGSFMWLDSIKELDEFLKRLEHIGRTFVVIKTEG